MDRNGNLEDTTSGLKQAFLRLEDDLTKIRTGRASASVLDGLMIEAYQTQVPLKQLASVIAPEAQLIQITPFDSTNIQNIAKAIREDQKLGLNPVDDGVVIRISIPPLTTERRQEIVKQLSDISEKCMIAMRNIRHNSLKTLDNDKKAKLLSEDDVNRLTKDIDALMSDYKTKVEQSVHSKEKEVMTI